MGLPAKECGPQGLGFEFSAIRHEIKMKERLEEFCYTKKDFVLDWYSGTGAGGQHRNKHQNCLRLTHIPSGITVSASESRSRVTNQRMAFERLKPLLLKWIRDQIKIDPPEKNTEVVRTYNEVDNRVKDHATGLKFSFSNFEDKLDELLEIRMNELPS